jgi:hypothetical protein
MKRAFAFWRWWFARGRRSASVRLGALPGETTRSAASKSYTNGSLPYVGQAKFLRWSKRFLASWLA